MQPTIQIDRLTEIAQEINSAKNDAGALLLRGAERMWTIGKLLAEAKPLCGHGNFEDWAESRTGLSPARCRQMANLYRKFPNGLPDEQERFKLGLAPDYTKGSGDKELGQRPAFDVSALAIRCLDAWTKVEKDIEKNPDSARMALRPLWVKLQGLFA